MPGSSGTGSAFRRREATVGDAPDQPILTPEQRVKVDEVQALATVILGLLGPVSRTDPRSLLAVLTVVLANIVTWVPNATPETDRELLNILVAQVNSTLANARLEVAPPAGSA
jgi:hypothetical protein